MRTVDEFVRDKVRPELLDVAALVRSLMAEGAPNAREMMSHGLPMWIDRSTLAWISPTKNDITFSFAFGVDFEDRFGLLKGEAKNARFVKIRSVDLADLQALRYYIDQAVQRDTRW